MKTSFKVFLCSTYNDLMAEREAVLEAIGKLQLQHDSMEFFGARSERPIETCLEEVQSSDILVVIVAHRYGRLVPDKNVSFTEVEYSEGHRLGKPCLVYLRGEDVPVLPKNMERESEKLRLLEEFKRTLTARHTIAYFRDSHDLSLQVAADLSRTAQALEAQTEQQPPSPGIVIIDEIKVLLQEALALGVSESSLLSTTRQAVTSLLRIEGRRRPLVFFIHSHAQNQIVKTFASRLQEEGIDVWLDEEQVAVGGKFSDKLLKGLDSADFLALFISRASMHDASVKKILNMLITHRLRTSSGATTVPILLENISIPALLRDVKYIDLRDGDISKGVRDLVMVIHHQRQNI